MSFIKEYAQKLVTAEEAVKVVKSHDWVDYGWTTGTPVALDAALAARADELEDVKIRGGILLREPEIFKVNNVADHFTWNSWHMGGLERKAISKGFAYYSPLKYSELPRYYRENIKHLNVAMFQVAPMDKHGFFNFGPNASHMMAVCEAADVIIVEVNENMPRCLGGFEEGIHVSRVDYIVEGENPAIGELGAGAPPTEVDKAVAQLIVEEIPDGACLQLGIGGMPNTVGSMIAESDLKDLGVHTEMYVDAFVDIAKAGKITGLKKNIDRGRQVYAFGAGTKKMYDYLDDNPECMSAPVDYTNSAKTIAQIDNFISINNAVDIDLYGQVNAESAGIKQISGAGGQLDFVQGAYLSKGGKSFICCSSTFTSKDGVKHTRIRPTLAEGSTVTDTRPNTHYVVTEFGKVCLKGMSTWERAEALINIAHPDFRDQLIKDAEKLAAAQKEKEKAKEPRKKVGFIAVSIGEGLNEIFKELGVDYIIEGGQTMNPSTEDMLTAIDHVNADYIYILPNNKNIVMAANQARDLTEDKDIIVIPTKTVPQGITAVLNYNAEEDVDTNEETMLEAIKCVKTGQVTYAVRDTHIDDKEIHEGDIMGIGDAGILAVGKSVDGTTKDMLAQLVNDDSELISLYYGEEVSEEEAEKLTAEIEELYPDMDVDAHMGGQPIYYYVLAVE